MNGRKQLSDEDGLAIAENWLNVKNRRNVTDRALKTAASANYDGENDNFEDDFDGFAMDELENTFLL